MKKIGVFLFLTIGTISNSYGADGNYCSGYAKTAVIQHINNLKHNCGFKGLRWSPLYHGQRKWCLTVRQSIAENEKKIRNKRLKQDCKIEPLGNLAWTKVEHVQKNKVIASAIDAAKKDDVMSLKIFRSQKVSLAHEWQGNYGSILYHAISDQKFQAVRYLIKFDTPNRTSNGGPNPLTNILNSSKVNYSLLEFLLRKGAHPNWSGELADDSTAPLYLAISKNDLRAVRILLKNSANPNYLVNQPPLILAIKKGNIAAVKLLLKYGANVNLAEYNILCKNVKQSNIQMPLDFAQQGGNHQIIQLLMKKGAKTGDSCRK